MELTIYTNKYNTSDAIHNFMDFYYSMQMKYLASELLEKGLSPAQITDAVARAIKIANASGMKAYKHFMPIFSGLKYEIIQDCKLSDLGYGLVLMNANPTLPIVGNFQVKILQEFLKVKN